ncbi:hypothetical protein OROMI_016196 [Orobanche minor]
MSTALRRTKRHPIPLPPPIPKVIHLTRSCVTRRKETMPTANLNHTSPLLLLKQQNDQSQKGKLENLFDKEKIDSPLEYWNPSPNTKSSAVVERRERVQENDRGEYIIGGGSGSGFKEEKWKLQAEILRAECKLLRIEREFALKKLEKNRVKMESSLRSAFQTLVSGERKIFEGKNVNDVLEEVMEDLAEKLEGLQKSSKNHKAGKVRKCRNFDKKGCLLRRRLEDLGGSSIENSRKGLQELDESSLRVDVKPGIDKASSFSSFKSTDEPIIRVRDGNKSCSGRCKAVVQRVAEQVRAETEQWSQMQEMLAQVREEMEELRTSRDFWENLALNGDHEIQSLRHDVEEWKEKAIGYENKVNELQLQLSDLKEEIQKSEYKLLPLVPLGKQVEMEKLVTSSRFKVVGELNAEEHKERTKKIDLPPLSLCKQLAKEEDKRRLLHHLREKRNYDIANGNKQEHPANGGRKIPYMTGFGVVAPNRQPLMDIKNISPLTKQRSISLFGFHSPESSRIRDGFRQ